MNFLERMDPEIARVTEKMPGRLVDFSDIPAARKALVEMFLLLPQPEVTGVKHEDRRVPGPKGAPEVLVRVYTPEKAGANRPALLWLHGGGYVLGTATMDDYRMRSLVHHLGCIIVSVDYRLAPENPFPAPVEDCYAALKWLAANASALGVDPKRIAIGGASAGGGLAAGLAILARDRAEIPICFQLLIYPMIDDRNATASSHAITDERTWNRQNNVDGWRAYLGRDPGGADTSPYAAASRVKDVKGLARAAILVGELDLFVDENIEYAHRLLKAGIPAWLSVYPGATHGFDKMAPKAKIAQKFNADMDFALRWGFGL